jgi:hypothetical protein
VHRGSEPAHPRGHGLVSCSPVPVLCVIGAFTLLCKRSLCLQVRGLQESIHHLVHNVSPPSSARGRHTRVGSPDEARVLLQNVHVRRDAGAVQGCFFVTHK